MAGDDRGSRRGWQAGRGARRTPARAETPRNDKLARMIYSPSRLLRSRLAFTLTPSRRRLPDPARHAATAPSPGLAQDQGDATAAYVRSHYTKYEERIPMRDGVQAVHGDLRTERRRRGQDLPDHAPPHPLHGRPLRPGPLPAVPRAFGALRPGGLHLRRAGRARALPVRGEVRRHAAGEHAAARRDERIDRHLRHHRLADPSRRRQQRQGRPLRHLLPRVLRLGRSDPLPPRPGRGLAPGADRRLVLGRHAPQRGVHPAAGVRLLLDLRPAAARAHDRAGRPLRPRHAGRLRLLPRAGTAVERQRALLPRQRGVLERHDRAPELRRVLAGAQHPAQPAGDRRGGDDGRRLVRHRGPRTARSPPTGRSSARTRGSSTSW